MLGISLSLNTLASAAAEPVEPFDPATLFDSDAGAWYDFNEADTMWQDTAGTTPAAADSGVARVDPSAGTFADIRQGTGAAQPIMRNDGTHNYLEFDATDDAFATAAGQAFSTSGLCTIVAGLIANGDSRAANVAVYGSPSGDHCYAIGTANTSSTFTPTSASRGSALSVATSTNQGAAPLVLTMQADVENDVNLLRINGAQVASDGTDQGTVSTASRTFIMGKQFGTGLNADVYGVLIIGRLLDAGEIEDVETMLAARIGAVLA